MAIMKAREDSIRVADSLIKVKEQLQAIEQARIDSINKANEERSSFDSRFKYNIIVGSFLTPDYARSLSEEYHRKGYDPRILKMESSNFELVAVEAYDNFQKAFSRLKQFQDTVQFESWMYIKK